MVTGVLLLDAHSARGVLGLLTSVGVDGFHRPVGIFSPFILGGVDLSVTVGEVDDLLTRPDPQSTTNTWLHSVPVGSR